VTFPITDRAYLAWGGASVGDKRRLRLRLADGTVYPFTGSWEFFDNEMSAETATLLVRALFPNKSLTLVPNAYVTVLADDADHSPVPVVHTTSIAVSGQKTGLWFLSPSNTVHFREVQIAARSGGKAALEWRASQPASSPKIVIQGIHKLGEGMRVNVVPASKFQ
jgi:membrane fusion protein (multidrug efflux system)